MNDNHIADERKPVAYMRRCTAYRDNDAQSDFDAKGYTVTTFHQNAAFAAEKPDEHTPLYAAPIAPRADADTAGAKPDRWADKTIACHECKLTYGESHMLSDIASGRVAVATTPASSVADAAGATCTNCGLPVNPMCNCERGRALKAAGASERADAEKDAARLDWLDATNKPFKMGWRVGIAPVGNVAVGSVIQIGAPFTPIREAIDAAILAANKEKP